MHEASKYAMRLHLVKQRLTHELFSTVLRKYAIAYRTTIDDLEGGTIVAPAEPPKSVAYHLVAVALQGEAADQHVTVRIPSSHKVGDDITLRGRVTAVLRKM
jgi:hypothetical protein